MEGISGSPPGPLTLSTQFSKLQTELKPYIKLKGSSTAHRPCGAALGRIDRAHTEVSLTEKRKSAVVAKFLRAADLQVLSLGSTRQQHFRGSLCANQVTMARPAAAFHLGFAGSSIRSSPFLC